MSGYVCHVMSHFTLVIGYILATTTTTRFRSPYGNDVRSNMTSLYSVYVRSAIECSIRCHNEPMCRGVNYVTGTGYCELIQVYTTTGDIEASVGTQFIMGPGMYVYINKLA
jgi:hypothetical protein